MSQTHIGEIKPNMKGKNKSVTEYYYSVKLQDRELIQIFRLN